MLSPSPSCLLFLQQRSTVLDPKLICRAEATRLSVSMEILLSRSWPFELSPLSRVCVSSYQHFHCLSLLCTVSEIYTVFQKTCDHIFDDKFQQNYPFTKIFGTLIRPTKSISHRQVFLVSHLTYFVQPLHLGKVSRPKYHEFSIKLLIFSVLLGY